ncbi:MAG: DUF1614 domain-containing protein [Halobacteriota archaeon]|nr:DUF1614 domain-containing protein [Halobacteriota archaeon]
MRTRLIFAPLHLAFIVLFLVVAGLVFSLFFFGLVGVAFVRIGFNWRHAMILLFATLIGSVINIPIKTVESEKPAVPEKYIRVFGVPRRIPIFDAHQTKTVIAANVGGAIIPAFISIYLLFRIPSQLIFALFGILIVTVVTHSMARPVRGLGITVPAFIPPLTAAASVILLRLAFNIPQSSVFVIAYASGVLGTLIGADILNLGGISKLGAPMASIGGAGTFDGVFLAGVIAVLIS